VHGHVWAKVLNAHCYLVEPVDKGPQGFSLLLANTNQGNGGQVVRLAYGTLRLELGHQRHEVVDRVGRKLCEPAKSSSLQRRGKHSSQDCIVRGIQAHVRSVGIHVLIWIGRVIIVIPVEAFPLI